MNKKIGNDTEAKCLEELQKRGYWCHLFAYNANGQPCDVVAMRGDVPILLDVKHCDGTRFAFSNIQPNQRSCFDYAGECGNTNLGFAIFFPRFGSWKWLPYRRVVELEERGVKSVPFGDLGDFSL